MPLGTARITRLALIVCGSVLLSVLGGCASLSDTPPAGHASAEPTPLSPSNPWLYPLETITGGFMGNAMVGNGETRLQRPVAVAVRDHYLYVVDADQELLYEYDTVSRRMSVLKDLRGLATAGPKPFMSIHPGVRPQNELQPSRLEKLRPAFLITARSKMRRVLHDCAFTGHTDTRPTRKSPATHWRGAF